MFVTMSKSSAAPTQSVQLDASGLAVGGFLIEAKRNVVCAASLSY